MKICDGTVRIRRVCRRRNDLYTEHNPATYTFLKLFEKEIPMKWSS